MSNHHDIFDKLKFFLKSQMMILVNSFIFPDGFGTKNIELLLHEFLKSENSRCFDIDVSYLFIGLNLFNYLKTNKYESTILQLNMMHLFDKNK